MSWLLLLILGGGAAAALLLLGVRGTGLMACIAALIAAAAGYSVAGQPRIDFAAEAEPVIPLTGARHAFYGNFSPVERWLVLSEGLGRAGSTSDAAGILQNAVKRYPGEPQLWVGLGNALVDHARKITPPAEFAFERAAKLSPGYPAPRFFYGLALARSGDRAAAASVWKKLLDEAPANAGWRPLVEQGVALLSEPAAP